MKERFNMNKKTVLLKNHSSFNIGGATDNFFEPQTVDLLIKTVIACFEAEMKPVFIGYGSNTLFPDNVDSRNCFISTKGLCGLAEKQADPNTGVLQLLSGTPVSLLSLIGKITGNDYDFTYLLPGTVGASVYMNARYMDREMCDIISSVNYIDLKHPEQGIKSITSENCNFGYKTSIFQEDDSKLITSVNILRNKGALTADSIKKIDSLFTLTLEKQEVLTEISYFSSFIREAAKNILREESLSFQKIENHRDKHHHFQYPSAGSVFQNSRELGKPIGKIIEELGLKGKKSGDARISPYHGNIIINTGSAKASDVLKIIDIMTREIFKVYRFESQLEIKIV